jgi:hypothetical protein
MMWFRSRKRDLEEWAEAIRPELRDLPVPPPSDGLLDRIVASRAAGARVILPDGRAMTGNAGARVALATLAAAVLLLALPFLRRSRPGTIGSDITTSSSSAASEWLPSPIAFAQTEPVVSKPPAPAIRWTRTDRLRPVVLEFLRTWRDSTGSEAGRINAVLTMDSVTLDGVRAWRLVSRNSGLRDGRSLLTIDSVVVARDDLRLLRRTSYQHPYSRYDEIRIVQAYHGDSILGRMNATGANATPASRPIARLLDPARGPYIIDTFAPVLLGAVALDGGWRGRAVMVGWAVVDRDVFWPIDLEVEGEETIGVPAGRFDCWRLVIRYNGHRFAYWVRKSDGVGVRTLERDSRTGAAREVVLVRDSFK